MGGYLKIIELFMSNIMSKEDSIIPVFMDKILPRIVALLAYALLSVILLGLLLAELFYIGYTVMVGYGIDPLISLLIVTAFTLAITGGLVAATIYHFKKLTMRRKLTLTTSNIAGRLKNIGAAFADGLNHPSKRRPTRRAN